MKTLNFKKFLKSLEADRKFWRNCKKKNQNCSPNTPYPRKKLPLRDPSDWLLKGFAWEWSPEGFDFWKTIHTLWSLELDNIESSAEIVFGDFNDKRGLSNTRKEPDLCVTEPARCSVRVDYLANPPKAYVQYTEHLRTIGAIHFTENVAKKIVDELNTLSEQLTQNFNTTNW